MKRQIVDLDIDEIRDLLHTAEDAIVNLIKTRELNNEQFMKLSDAFKQLDRACDLMFYAKII